ncbi:hypothetical protein C8A05DRAFT_20009 [Staphylotrichum tortipilum]|uniref:TauD/TfdA-like domain-containing protein n=1 Tax=Staphylotrichum tortipilum TaxID=2831512 RepID=A0AAN6RP08_9PEZI|nr:hypothetical protein C8A05DRAFT_20009 [Staphylotrichum longicolle]
MIPQVSTVPTVATGPALKRPGLVEDPDTPGHVYVLSAAEKAEVAAAMAHFEALGLDGDQISPATFPLPTLGPVLRALTADLHHGRGFFILRGLTIAGLLTEDTILRYLGIASFVADKIGVQDEHGNVFAHIREAKYALARQEDRPIRDSTLASHFHTDEAADILAMHTSGLAAEGGDHFVAPAAAVYDVLCRTCPEVIPTLTAPIWYFDTRGLLASLIPRPLLYFYHHRSNHPNTITTTTTPQPIFSFNQQALHRLPNIPPLSPLAPPLTPPQLAALTALERAARQVHTPLRTHLGDISFVNNLTTLHAREAFVDDPPRGKVRYLVRMWLKDTGEGMQGLPEPLEQLNQRLFAQEGEVEGVRRVWNVVGKMRVGFSFAERLGP